MATPVSVDLTVVGTTSVDESGSPVYTTTYTTSNAINIPEEIFLFLRGTTQSDDTFIRVCALSDLTDFPATRDPGFTSYRANTATVDHASVIDAKNHIDRIVSAVSSLLESQQQELDNGFMGTSTMTISAPGV